MVLFLSLLLLLTGALCSEADGRGGGGTLSGLENLGAGGGGGGGGFAFGAAAKISAKFCPNRTDFVKILRSLRPIGE